MKPGISPTQYFKTCKAFEQVTLAKNNLELALYLFSQPTLMAEISRTALLKIAACHPSIAYQVCKNFTKLGLSGVDMTALTGSVSFDYLINHIQEPHVSIPEPLWFQLWEFSRLSISEEPRIFELQFEKAKALLQSEAFMALAPALQQTYIRSHPLFVIVALTLPTFKTIVDGERLSQTRIPVELKHVADKIFSLFSPGTIPAGFTRQLAVYAYSAKILFERQETDEPFLLALMGIKNPEVCAELLKAKNTERLLPFYRIILRAFATCAEDPPRQILSDPTVKKLYATFMINTAFNHAEFDWATLDHTKLPFLALEHLIGQDVSLIDELKKVPSYLKAMQRIAELKPATFKLGNKFKALLTPNRLNVFLSKNEWLKFIDGRAPLARQVLLYPPNFLTDYDLAMIGSCVDSTQMQAEQLNRLCWYPALFSRGRHLEMLATVVNALLLKLKQDPNYQLTPQDNGQLLTALQFELIEAKLKENPDSRLHRFKTQYMKNLLAFLGTLSNTLVAKVATEPDVAAPAPSSASTTSLRL